MTISIEGPPGSGKSMFARYFQKTTGIKVHGLSEDIDINEKDRINDPSLRCIMTCCETERTVRYLVRRSKVHTRGVFTVSRLIFRRGDYVLRETKLFQIDYVNSVFKPKPFLSLGDRIFYILIFTVLVYLFTGSHL